MRKLEVIDSELRLLAAARESVRGMGGSIPSVGPVDALLDERAAVSQAPEELDPT